MIEHFQDFMSSTHKYYSIFENEFEDALIKTNNKLETKQNQREAN